MSEIKNNYIFNTPNGIIIIIKLVPNSSFNKIVDYTEEFIKIKISAPPVENRANKELIEFISDISGVNKSNISIISGEKSKLKKILIKNGDFNLITQKIMFVLNSLNKNKKV